MNLVQSFSAHTLCSTLNHRAICHIFQAIAGLSAKEMGHYLSSWTVQQLWNPYRPKRRALVLEILTAICHSLDLNKVASSLRLSVPLLAKLQTHFLASIQGVHSWELPDPLSRAQCAQAGQAFLRISCYGLHPKCNKLVLKMSTFCVC